MPFEEPDIETVRVLLPTRVGSAGTGGQFTLNASTGSVSLVAGSNVTLQSNASTITINATVPAGQEFTLNGSTGSVSLVAGNNITLQSNASTITISAAPAGGTQSISGGGTSITGSAVSVALFGGNNISLASASGAGSLSLTFNASSNALNNVSLLNGSSGALSISAGAGIGIGQANSTITISASVQTATVSLTALGNTTSSSSGTITNLLNVSGAGIVSVGVGAGSLTISATTPSVTNYSTISGSVAGNVGATTTFTIGNQLQISAAGILSATASGSSITLSAPAAAAGTVISAVQISGNTSGTSSLISNGTVYLQAISNIGLSQSTTTGANSTTSNVISIFGPAYSAGVGLALSTTGGVISYAAPGAAVTSNVINAFQISGNTSGTSSLIQTGTVYLQAVSLLGLSQSTTTGANASTSNVVSIFGPAYAAGAGLAVSTTGGSVSYAATNFVSSVNGSSGALSISAGAGIGIGQANSTITISASVQTSTITATMAGNTLGAASTTLTVANSLSISGAGAVSVGASAGTLTISGGSTLVAGVNLSITTGGSSITINASSNAIANVAAFGTGVATSTGTIVLAAGANITLNTGVSSITIVGAAGGAAGTQSLSGGGTSVTGTAVSLAIVAGTNISLASASGAGSLTLTVSGGSTLVAGSGISLTSGGSSITIVNTGAPCSYTQNANLQQVAGTIVTKAGTITGTAGVGSSLFLNRIMIPAVMNLSEIDVAMSIGFPATSQGAGTMSRSMVLYSFGNSTSLASVISTSGTSAWQTGTSTSGAVVSLTQFQGGWSTPLIQPFTFASSSVSPGEYVVGQLFNFAQGSSTWTIAFYGAQAATNASALSSGGLVAASAFTGTTSSALTAFTGPLTVASAFSTGGTLAASGITAITQNATNNVSWFVSRATSGTTSVASATSSFTFVEAPFVGSLGTAAGSIITATALVNAISNSVTGAFGVMGSGGLSAGSIFGSTTSMAVAQQALPNFGYIGTGSTTSGLPTAFSAGIMSTGAIPTAITVTSAAVTYSGSIAFQQPWFALLGT